MPKDPEARSIDTYSFVGMQCDAGDEQREEQGGEQPASEH
jgi:hypothetical protein